MSTNSEGATRRILSGAGAGHAWPLFGVAQTRDLESVELPAGSPTLMQRAGLALARLALALAPHARTIWVACGPGNNGGDGLEAAAHLKQWGKQVVVTLAHDPATASPPAQYDFAIDALFGIGTLRPLQGVYADWVRHMNASPAPILAVDIPTGLHADTGVAQDLHVAADYTLSLLTLKPGLFTGAGRDACGDIWFNALGVQGQAPAQAMLSAAWHGPARIHASHKGSYGDVAVVGGAEGMVGAALLAGRSALYGGAGRVFVCPLGEMTTLDNAQPELMLRNIATLDCSAMTVVAGCGGGHEIGAVLPALLEQAKHLVLDADALNCIAHNPTLQQPLRARAAGSTVMTPHPLETARLLGMTTPEVQSDRLRAAQTLADRYQSMVVLKGSGTVIAAPNATPRINPTGNAKLATAGTGDVLAGLIAAHWAGGEGSLEAASHAVYRHGLAADRWPGPVLTASALCQWQ